MLSNPICPRCGYDLSGEVARWEEACPLHGRCSECGTEFEWEILVHAERAELAWMFEHGRGLSSTAGRWPSTLLRVLVPPLFWRDLHVTRPVNLGRAFAWLLVPCVLMHLLASALALWLTAAFRPGPLDASDVVGALTVPLSDFDFEQLSYFGPSSGPVYPYCVAVFSFLWLFTLAVMPWTRRRAKLRRAHLLRAIPYSLWWLMGLCAFRLGRNLLFANALLGTARTPGAGLRLPPGVRAIPGPILNLEYLWPWTIGLGLFAWTLWWWWCAACIGWRIDRARLVWLLLTVAGCIGALAAGVSGNAILEVTQFLRLN